jgi:hypothetical protein
MYCDYEDVIDWVSCEECLDEGYKVEARKHINERDLCNECYERSPKCPSCGVIEWDSRKTYCADCLKSDEQEKEEERLFLCLQSLHYVDIQEQELA